MHFLGARWKRRPEVIAERRRYRPRRQCRGDLAAGFASVLSPRASAALQLGPATGTARAATLLLPVRGSSIRRAPGRAGDESPRPATESQWSSSGPIAAHPPPPSESGVRTPADDRAGSSRADAHTLAEIERAATEFQIGQGLRIAAAAVTALCAVLAALACYRARALATR
ncbi:hypothetical protein [Nocardia abscessus]|uniref:hypothetical protein n=1 Tax=Nocardia abscessus TaxID=120957 RepID=UPI0024543FA9|nr:hypothetical protein [Nocardia abscessus]